jgi:hypothetical protein
MKPKRLFRYFQSRIAEPVECIDAATTNAGIKGGVRRDKKTNVLQAILPLGQTAEGRTIRLHEADHVRYTPVNPAWEKNLKANGLAAGLNEQAIYLIMNGIEDARISQLPVWNIRSRNVRRDAAASALRELRGVMRKIRQAKNLDPELLAMVKANLLNTALRGVALVNMAFANGECHGQRTINYCSGRMRDAFSSFFGMHISDLVKLISSGRLNHAANQCIAICTPPTKPQPASSELELGTESSADYDDDADHDGDPLGVSQTNTGLRLIRPPLTAPMVPPGDANPTETHVAFGYRIRRGILSQIAIGIPATRPFIRPATPHLQGVVLIDASGSMKCNNEKLAHVCRLAPGSMVLYYSAANENTYLVVYGQDGMRLADGPLPNHEDGNGLDAQCIKYALAKRHRLGCDSPVLYVTDKGFDENLAHQVCASAERHGSLRVIPSIDDAIAEFSNQP